MQCNQWRSYVAEGPCAEACDGPPSNKAVKKLFICILHFAATCTGPAGRWLTCQFTACQLHTLVTKMHTMQFAKQFWMNCDISSYNEEKRQHHLWPCVRGRLLLNLNRQKRFSTDTGPQVMTFLRRSLDPLCGIDLSGCPDHTWLDLPLHFYTT